ncbi:MAG: hypothetical protein JSW52_07010 [Candidatus Coatesbacteria bacterium]|nr:MAG: hypothetical protein JSW52_07010 [Candidatus Coatesbacteria bacterium]
MRLAKLISIVAAVAYVAGCGGDTSFPGWNPDDEGAIIYYVRAAGNGAETAAITTYGNPVNGTGWPCDPRAGILPVGDKLFFVNGGALYVSSPGEEPTALVDFGSGTAKETRTDDASGYEIVTSWHVDNSITGLCVDESERLIGFLLNQLMTPSGKEHISRYTEADIARFSDRDSFSVDEGAYVIDLESSNVEYLLPTTDVFCFTDESHLALEYALTLCTADVGDPDEVAVVVPDDYFELGWSPVAASGGGTTVTLCNKAKPGSDTLILNRLYVLEERRLPESPTATIEARERADRVIVSPNGRYAAVDVVAGSLGVADLYVVDLETGAYELLAENSSAYSFLPSSNGLVCFTKGATPGRGDLWAAGLDGSEVQRLTDTGDVLPPP